jgi:hypothetical protein
MNFKYEDDREPVSEAIRGNFGTFDLFLERLKEMRDDYCGAKSIQSSSAPVSSVAAVATAAVLAAGISFQSSSSPVSSAAAAVLVGGKADLKVAILLQIFNFII